MEKDKEDKPIYKKYYVRGTVMEMEEDLVHEFKGHKNIAIEEIPPWCVDVKDNRRKTRNCISRNICGFLNSGLGGTIFLGVLDDGLVDGIPLTRYQRDHIRLSLNDTLNRFRPPVPKHLVSVKFVNCVDAHLLIAQNTNDVASSGAFQPMNMPPKGNVSIEGMQWLTKQTEKITLPKEMKFKDDKLRKRHHTLRTYVNCWCEDDFFTRTSHGRKIPSFVVEITIKRAEANDPEIRKFLPPSSKINVRPIFQAEDGSIYIKQQGSLIRQSFNDTVKEVIEDIQHTYYPTIKEVEHQLKFLQTLPGVIESFKLESNSAEDTEGVMKDIPNKLNLTDQ